VVPEEAEVADQQALSLEPQRRLRTRVAGLFLFLPLLAKLRFDQLARRADYPGSKMVPAHCGLLSLLALKLLDKERRSHISDFNFEEAAGLFAGLNILPKKSFATDYSYRTQRLQQEKLLSGWVAALAPLLFPDAGSFSLDFHPIPFRGDDSGLDKHYIPQRGRAGPSVLTFFAQEQKSRVLCYENANLTRADQPQELMRFVEFWHTLMNRDPEWLYFDSKLVPYRELSRVNQRGIHFVTIRRRGVALLRKLQAAPRSQWRTAVIDIPKRRHKRIRYLDETITLRGYDGPIRQLAVDHLGHQQPTLFLSNALEHSPRELIMNYARRNHVEDGLGTSVDFFHLDCLTSEVRLNVDLDAALTVLAHGCYRWLANCLRGFEQAKPKQLYRKFVETGGLIEIESREIVVSFDRRSHNPLVREAGLDTDVSIPWLNNFRLRFMYS